MMWNKGKSIIAVAVGGIVGVVAEEATIGRIRRSDTQRCKEENRKFQEFYSILLQWVHLHNEGKSVGRYLKGCGYNTIAIYGMKELGEELLYELKDSEVEVKYVIDKNADDLYVDKDVYRPDQELKQVDAVIVTAVHWFDEIEIDMKKKLECPILSLEDVIYDAGLQA